MLSGFGGAAVAPSVAGERDHPSPSKGSVAEGGRRSAGVE